ncbi:uncharacterized protein PRCAT00004263001 [Priceomyces carsonii]|uniref:uncharacterized protein n=1 Tax=Priceomyces carsonii TaxID=28549 RepID=UPI002ED8FE6F|nr:unnamed protein product [Priceomyces carsonii]
MSNRLENSKEKEQIRVDIGIVPSARGVSEESSIKIFDEKRLRRKIDRLILPFLMIIYGLQFLDKTLLNYAGVMGIKDNLQGNEFSNLGTIFYASYFAGEIIVSIMIQKFPIGRLLGCCVALWGAIICFHAATKQYAGLMVLRTLLGLFEAPVAPCLIAITAMWWTKAEQARRTCLWYMMIGVAQIIGSLISFGFQHVKSTNIASWQILFVFMGILTFLVGLLTIYFLPNDPESCSFFTKDEKLATYEHVKVNNTGVKNKTYKPYQIKELLFQDKQTWILTLIMILVLIQNGAITNFTGIIIASFGYSNQLATLIQIPTGVVTVSCTLIAGYCTGKFGNRTLMIIVLCVPSLLGTILIVALKEEQRVGRLFGVYLLNAIEPVIPIIYNWNSVNTSGYTKITTRNALTLCAFCVGNMIGPQTFRETDAPNYIPAKITLIVLNGIIMLLCLVLRFIVKSENKKKQILEIGSDNSELDLDLTDIEKKSFLYID